MQTIFTDLANIINDLGRDGGLISPSIYDTAQRLRFAPPAAGVKPALRWLLEQQRADGGWGRPTALLTRDVPTLAALLALTTYRDQFDSQDAIPAGLAFLRTQAPQWQYVHPDQIPIAAELILPNLLCEAAGLGLTLPEAPYARLRTIGAKRRRLIQRLDPGAGTPPVHSWESWGMVPDPSLLDSIGSIGHSPAATAAWLRAAADHPGLTQEKALARQYLTRAERATRQQIPGVVPTVFPITGFELSYGLYILLVTGLWHHPDLFDVAQAKSREMATIMVSGGLTFGEFFTPDGDCTAAAVAVLSEAGRHVELEMLSAFQSDDHFLTYPHELNPSIFTTARAVHALHRAGQQTSTSEAFLINQQKGDGRWPADKWHTSWPYTTLEAMLALTEVGRRRPVQKGAEAWVHYQHDDGGWGANGQPTVTETAYGILALDHLKRQDHLNHAAHDSLARAQQWILNQYGLPGDDEERKHWVGKEIYRPERVDQAFELSAILSAVTVEPVR